MPVHNSHQTQRVVEPDVCELMESLNKKNTSECFIFPNFLEQIGVKVDVKVGVKLGVKVGVKMGVKMDVKVGVKTVVKVGVK